MGADSNNILQSYSDILPGRATALEHRAPEDDLMLRPHKGQSNKQAQREYPSWSVKLQKCAGGDGRN
jgi:hypothetical protein